MLNRRKIRQQSPYLAHTATIILATLIALPCAGCDDRDGSIRSYTVPKEQVPVVALPDAPPARDEVGGPMAWDLPEGWTTLPNPNQTRFATLGVGDGAGRIETAITMLGGPAGGIEANVNMWRSQVGLPIADAAEMDRIVHTVRGQDGAGVWVDLSGPAPGDEVADAPRMFGAIFPTETGTWFIKTMGSHAALEPHRDDFLDLCKSVRLGGGTSARRSAPSAGTAPRTPAGSPASGPTWSLLPEGWTVDGTPRPMSVASITVSDGSGQASLTITPLGGAQDLLANVNRWRGQVGLGPISDLSEAPAVAIEIAGSPGQLVDIAGAERRTLGAVSVRDGTTWFYKLTGPDALVAGAREGFEDFVRSIRFEAAPDE